MADGRSSRMALLRTRRTSSCSKAFSSSLEAVRTRSNALGRIAPEAGEAGEASEAGEVGEADEAGVRRPPSAGLETCPTIEWLVRPVGRLATRAQGCTHKNLFLT